MADLPHDFSVGVGTAPVTADPVWRFTCAECNWTHLIATAGAPPVQQPGPSPASSARCMGA